MLGPGWPFSLAALTIHKHTLFFYATQAFQLTPCIPTKMLTCSGEESQWFTDIC